MKRIYRLLIRLMVVLLVIVMLTSCSTTTTYEPTGELYINTPIFMWSADAFKEFKDANPEIKASAEGDINQYYRFRRYITVPDEDYLKICDELQAYYDQLQLDLMKSQSSDIVMIDNFYWDYDVDPLDYQKMARSGAFVDLYSLFDQVGYDRSGLEEKYLKSLELNGKLFYYPSYTLALVFSTTKKVMEENNFPYDPNDTVMEFLRKCAEWKEANPDGPEVFSSEYWTYLYQYWYQITGYDIVNLDKGTVSIDTDEVKELLSLIKALKPKNYDPDIYASSVEANEMQSYYQRSCLFSEYSTINNTMLEEGDYLMLVPIRQQDGTTMSYVSRIFWAVPSNANNIYTAGQFLTYELEYSKEVNMNSVGIDADIFSIHKACNEQNIALACETYGVDQVTYEDVMKDWYEKFDQILIPQCWNYTLREYFDEYFADKITVDELTRVLQDKMKIYISE